MGFHHVRDNEGNLHSLDDEQYLQYLEEQRNSWPNKIKRFFYKVLAIVIAITIFLALVGQCVGGDKEHNSKSDNSEKVETNDKQSVVGVDNEVKSIEADEIEEIKSDDAEIESEEDLTNNINVEELSKEEEINNNLNEEVEENMPTSSQEKNPEDPQTDE